MDDLIGRRIGDLTVVRVFRNKRNRNVYVVQHDDGKTFGLKGYELNRVIIQNQSAESK